MFFRKSNVIFFIFLIFISSLTFTVDNTVETNAQDSNLTINSIAIDFLWNFTLTDFAGHFPVIVDLDLDGTSEVLVTSQNGLFYCLDNLGNTLWQHDLALLGRCSPTVVDINKDGKLEILITSFYTLHCFNYTGTELWNASITYNMLDSPTIADLDQDGQLDIILQSTNKIHCFNWNGTVKWEHTTLGTITTVTVVADLDSDGSFEILFGTYDNKTICLNHLGVKEWQYMTD